VNQASFAKGTLTTSPQTSFGGNSYTVTLTLTSPISQTSPLGGNVNFKLDQFDGGQLRVISVLGRKFDLLAH
jgi:hypothetical protein